MSPTAQESIRRAADEILDASRHCIDRHQINASLILLYSGIDQMGWLARPAGKPDSDRSDFIRWVELYLFPATGIDCSALDLYAARCGILHSQAAEARLTREEEAAEIWYASGKPIPHELESLYHVIADEDAPKRAIHVEELHDAFEQAVERFFAALETDEALLTRVRPRAGKVLATLTVD